MFEIAVPGPVATRGLGVVRQCIDCRAAAGPNAQSCQGFGAGCLVAPAQPPSHIPAQGLSASAQ